MLNYNTAGFNQAVNNYNSLAEPVREEPQISAEFARLSDSLRCLEEQAEWLLNRIAPLCQPASPAPTGTVAGEQTKASPSQFRAELASMRARIDSVSSRLASVKYTIEV